MTNITLPPYAESLLVHLRRAECLKRDCIGFPSIDLNSRQLCDQELLPNRAYFPLEGYLSQADYRSVLEHNRLTGGAIWPIPVCLDVDTPRAEKLEPGQRMTLRDEEGFMLAVPHIEEIRQPDKRLEALSVFRTDDPDKHPGVRHS
jgi:sulfate adenylyltransferase